MTRILVSFIFTSCLYVRAWDLTAYWRRSAATVLFTRINTIYKIVGPGNISPNIAPSQQSHIIGITSMLAHHFAAIYLTLWEDI